MKWLAKDVDTDQPEIEFSGRMGRINPDLSVGTDLSSLHISFRTLAFAMMVLNFTDAASSYHKNKLNTWIGPAP